MVPAAETARTGDNSHEISRVNLSLTVRAEPYSTGRLIRPNSEARMRSHWVLTVSELILFVAAVTFMATGFVWIAGG
jgi:hypothetical protein